VPNIYRIEPTDRVFSITWNIGTRCNYDCMYCPTSLHDNHSKHASLDLLKQRWQSIFSKTAHKNLPYKISFTGGEVTVNKSFLPLLRWMRENYQPNIAKILVTSNGSASLNYYTKLYALVDNLSLSFHSEHADEQKFFDLVIKLHQDLLPDKHLHVNIMNETWNQHRIPAYQKILDQHGISNAVNNIDYSMQTRSFPILKGKSNLEIH
jgi:MoaA/NifB/PqqE/SkfB family radical SAM enzyme